MKQWLIAGMILVLGLLLTACNLKAIGSTKYYVEVQNGGEEYTEHDQTRYEYELTGFDKEGNDKELSFTANHQLKKGAYLQVDYKNEEVITYEEVEDDDIPEKAQELLKDNDDS